MEQQWLQKISGVQLKDLYKSFVNEYPIVSIEDPFDQDDWEHYRKMTAECGDKVRIVGDNILVTNPTRVKKAIAEKTCNALLLKWGNKRHLHCRSLCGFGNDEVGNPATFMASPLASAITIYGSSYIRR